MCHRAASYTSYVPSTPSVWGPGAGKGRELRDHDRRDGGRAGGGGELVGLGDAGRGEDVHGLRHRVRISRADLGSAAGRAHAEAEAARGRGEVARLVGAEPVLAGEYHAETPAGGRGAEL